MALRQETVCAVPEATARAARAAFPKGNRYVRLHEHLGSIFADEQFAALFSENGRPAESPWRLALVTVLQAGEGLSDRQAAEAVRSRIDWKYLLALELDDAGFDHSILTDFRARLIANNQVDGLLDTLNQRLRQAGLLAAGGRQRTDATHVLAAVRTLNRLELVGEVLRAALNSLAVAAPDWIADHLTLDWFDRYGRRVEDYRLPHGNEARTRLAVTMGCDGYRLLDALSAPEAPAWLRQIPAVDILRQVWSEQFHRDGEAVRWQADADLPPAGQRINSPYDAEARFAQKRSTSWTGYKVHLTETCPPSAPHLIVQVMTTPASTADVTQTEAIQAGLIAKNLCPEVHLVDAGYVSAAQIETSRQRDRIVLHGPVLPGGGHRPAPPDEDAFTLADFLIDWTARRVTCPTGHTNTRWATTHTADGRERFHVRFATGACRACPSRARCTNSPDKPRQLTLQSQADQEALMNARREQETEPWKKLYNQRAGIEGTISQAVRTCGIRSSRYRGLAKTHFAHIAAAFAINLARLEAWWTETPRAKTRVAHFAALRQPQAA